MSGRDKKSSAFLEKNKYEPSDIIPGKEKAKNTIL
jgi:hypothetical protein